MKKLSAILMSAIMVLALASCADKTPASTSDSTSVSTSASVVSTATDNSGDTAPKGLGISKDIVVLYVNDVHCGIDDNLGYQNLVTVKNAYEALGHKVILVDNGDAIQGDTVGTLSKGEYIVDLMNEAGFDVATPGNHEFDYGMDRFLELTKKANYPYVSCNFVDKDGNAVLAPYTIIDAEGVKIAFIGISTPKTLTSSTPAYFMNDNGEYVYFFCQDETGEKLYNQVQASVDAAKAEGAQFVVAMAHLGTEADCSPWMSTEVINNTTGIDAVLDGHSHSVWNEEKVKNKDGKDVILTSTGTKLNNIGVMTIDNFGEIHSGLVNDNAVSGNSTKSVVTDIQEQYEELVNQVVAHTDVDLAVYDPTAKDADGNAVRIIRSQETNLGDLCADAYRAMSGADVAIVNGGGIRSNIPAGDITYGQIIKVHPFGNSMCVVETTGEEIYQALEMSASKLPSEFGGFLHVSGMTFTIDVNVPSPVVTDENKMFVKVEGEARVKDIMIGGEAIDLTKTYTLACHDYKLKNMGDGYSMFADNKFLQDSVMIDNQVLINYIVDVLGGTVGEEYADPYGQGRITIID